MVFVDKLSNIFPMDEILPYLKSSGVGEMLRAAEGEAVREYTMLFFGIIIIIKNDIQSRVKIVIKILYFIIYLLLLNILF